MERYEKNGGCYVSKTTEIVTFLTECKSGPDVEKRDSGEEKNQEDERELQSCDSTSLACSRTTTDDQGKEERIDTTSTCLDLGVSCAVDNAKNCTLQRPAELKSPQDGPEALNYEEGCSASSCTCCK